MMVIRPVYTVYIYIRIYNREIMWLLIFLGHVKIHLITLRATSWEIVKCPFLKSGI